MPTPRLSDELCSTTLAQWEAADRNATHASIAAGMPRGTFQNRLREALARAGGADPSTDTASGAPREGLDPYVIKGVSTYYDANGDKRGEWVKTKLDDQRRAELIRAAFEAMAVELPRLASIDAPGHVNEALCNVYTITDFHMGMLAWHKEGGADWDINIASRTLDGCFRQMVYGAPAAGTCVIAQLGDFLHYDGLTAVTPLHGHVLDADGRFSKMVAATLTALRNMVDIALTRHARVVILLAEGNHDMASSVWLRHMFAALYENEPRVEVIDSELPYYAFQFGSVMLGWHHGHMAKNESLPSLFAAQFRSMWGAVKYVSIHTGHRHHREVKEHSGAIVEQHPTLASRDAYAARGGWHAERAATGITYHRDFGEVARNTVRPEMLQ